MKTTKPANLTQMLRNVEFAFVGFCADESVRVGIRGNAPAAHQFPATHPRYSEMLALAKIENDDDFESAVVAIVMGAL